MTKNETIEALKTLKKHCFAQKIVADHEGKPEKGQAYGEMFERLTSLIERLEENDNCNSCN